MLVTSIFSFSYNVFYSNTDRNNISATFNLLSANALNLVQSENLSFGKELSGLECLSMYSLGFSSNVFQNTVVFGKGSGVKIEIQISYKQPITTQYHILTH